MLLVPPTTGLLRLVTSSAANIDVHASYVTHDASAPVPGMANITVAAAATTTIFAGHASAMRSVKTIHCRNRHATTACDVTINLTDGTTSCELIKVTLPAGYALHYDEGAGFEVLDSFGRSLSNSNANGSQAAVNALNLVVLGGDITNNNAVANTIADITGLSFAVTAGEAYWFCFNIVYTAAATTTGSRFSVQGPGAPTWLAYRSSVSLVAGGTSGTDSFTDTSAGAYDIPAAANASSATATAAQANTAIIEGFIQPSANGTVIARFASEIASSAIVAKRGSLLQWYRVI